MEIIDKELNEIWKTIVYEFRDYEFEEFKHFMYVEYKRQKYNNKKAAKAIIENIFETALRARNEIKGSTNSNTHHSESKLVQPLFD